ncbi:MAG: hypothetical protein ACM3SQ_09085 [Betaproteobacteria bacterium]
MAWTSEIDPPHRLIYTRVAGPLRFADAVAHRIALAADPRFDRAFCHVLDLEGVASIELTTDEVVRLAAHSVLSAPARQAIVASADVVFGVARMYDAYRESNPRRENIVVCRSMFEAYLRLGLDRFSDDTGNGT